jgi:hypothetical protein
MLNMSFILVCQTKLSNQNVFKWIHFSDWLFFEYEPYMLDTIIRKQTQIKITSISSHTNEIVKCYTTFESHFPQKETCHFEKRICILWCFPGGEKWVFRLFLFPLIVCFVFFFFCFLRIIQNNSTFVISMSIVLYDNTGVLLLKRSLTFAMYSPICSLFDIKVYHVLQNDQRKKK